LAYVVEVDGDANATLANNREGVEKGEIHEDVNEVKKNDIQSRADVDSVDLFAGGPPYQGFSEVISPDGSDERNHLFGYFMD